LFSLISFAAGVIAACVVNYVVSLFMENGPGGEIDGSALMILAYRERLKEQERLKKL